MMGGMIDEGMMKQMIGRGDGRDDGWVGEC